MKSLFLGKTDSYKSEYTFVKWIKKYLLLPDMQKTENFKLIKLLNSFSWARCYTEHAYKLAGQNINKSVTSLHAAAHES